MNTTWLWSECLFLSCHAVPATPEIQVSECQVCDNTVTVVWTLAEPDSKIDHYILEHRRTNHEGPPRIREDYPWMVVEGIREMEHTITGRRGSYIYICIYILYIIYLFFKYIYFYFILIFLFFGFQGCGLTPATWHSEWEPATKLWPETFRNQLQSKHTVRKLNINSVYCEIVMWTVKGSQCSWALNKGGL